VIPLSVCYRRPCKSQVAIEGSFYGILKIIDVMDGICVIIFRIVLYIHVGRIIHVDREELEKSIVLFMDIEVVRVKKQVAGQEVDAQLVSGGSGIGGIDQDAVGPCIITVDYPKHLLGVNIG